MQQLNPRSRILSLAAVAALAAALGAPAAAEPVYSWRTEDGGYAFTDDPKSIPARYRDQAKTRGSSDLGGYARYTPSDGAASERYAEQLTRRLEYLRAFNAPPATPGTAVVLGGSGPPATVTLNSEDDFTPAVQLTKGLNGGAGAGSDEPIEVDTLFTRPPGKIVTRQTTVVRQGDKILSIMKPRLREWNVATDIHDESELGD